MEIEYPKSDEYRPIKEKVNSSWGRNGYFRTGCLRITRHINYFRDLIRINT